MAYQVLARKWRPKKFSDLVGQEHVVKALRNALDEGRLHHAYLLTGTRGVGKTTIARILAKSLNCENAVQGEPCGSCSSCIQIDTGRYVDLLEIDAASNTGIDNIREVLENAQYAPTSGKYKVYIIDEVHMLSKNAFNAMLKTLEEPPEHAKFILATTDPHKVPITVLSRCLQFVLRNMTTQQVAGHLAYVLDVEKIEYEDSALHLLGRAASGSMRDALSLLDQAIAMGSGSVVEQDVRQMIGAVDKQYLYELLQGIVEQNGEALLAKAQEMAERAIGFDSALSELAMLLQQLALLQAVPSSVDRDNPDREVLLKFAHLFSGEQIQLYYQCAIHGKQDLSLAPDEYAGFVMTLLRMLAFAPIAARGHGVADVIEYTELNDVSDQNVAEKKSLGLEQRPSESSVHFISQTTDSPPWEEQEVEHNKQNLSQIVDKNHHELRKQNHDVSVKTKPFEVLDKNKFADSEKVAPIEKELSGNIDSIEDVQISLAEQDEEVDDEPQFLPFPEFKPENWFQIIKRFASQIGAAQMLAQHAAWISYHSDTHLMVLALTDEARATANKERLDKIRDVLASAYALPLKLQTQAWRSDANWETPKMREQRLQQEGREQAMACLEADKNAQEIIRIFEAKWQPDSLILADMQ